MFFSFYRFIVFISFFLFYIHYSAFGKDALVSLPDISEELMLEVYREQMMNYFLNTLYENSFCNCGDNNGCTRGCRLPGLLDEKNYPPVRRCVGRKRSYKSSEDCAKHVNGAIMTVIHDFLAFHCRFAAGGRLENKEEYDQCNAHFTKSERSNNVNICWNGFKFESAFCMLNLDGQNADIYHIISDKKVRKNCRYWDRYNQLLLAVNASSYYGGISIIPIFKKLSPERNKEFREDPSRIPEGAIIVTKSDSKHGHVEVKTNRKECGKGKNLTCFCSDFCRERIEYDYSVLAVFEWNPEFIRYVSLVDTLSEY